MNKKRTLMILCVCTTLLAAEIGYIGYRQRDVIRDYVASAQAAAIDRTAQIVGTGYGLAYMAADGIQNNVRSGYENFTATIDSGIESVTSFKMPEITLPTIEMPTFTMPDWKFPDFKIPTINMPKISMPDITLPDFKMVTFRQQHREMKEIIATDPIYLADYSEIEPAAGEAAPEKSIEDQKIDVEAVLVPQKVTVISSSRDGRISHVFVENGDTFKKGDVLIEYDCDDLNAETEIIEAEKSLIEKKTAGTEKLFKLDLISDLEKMDTQTKAKQLDARIRLYQARMDQCRIYAGFDGRVTNRLANDNEYTRTDRVLMEIASLEPLRAEFLIPSKWLRWVNVGAPLNIILNETDRTYSARVTRIHGEVDPVSQSIQVVATMDDYDDPLLPGMSGQAELDTQRINGAGITGFLQTSKPH